MTASNREALLDPKLLSSTVANNAVTVGSGEKITLDSAFVANLHTSDVTVTAYIVPSGGTAGDATNACLPAMTIPAGQAVSLTGYLSGIVLEEVGSSLQLDASVDAKLFCAVYGRRETV